MTFKLGNRSPRSAFDIALISDSMCQEIRRQPTIVFSKWDLFSLDSRRPLPRDRKWSLNVFLWSFVSSLSLFRLVKSVAPSTMRRMAPWKVLSCINWHSDSKIGWVWCWRERVFCSFITSRMRASEWDTGYVWTYNHSLVRLFSRSFIRLLDRAFVR